MRPEQIEKLGCVTGVIGNSVFMIGYGNLPEDQIERASKQHFRNAVERIRSSQSQQKVDGYVVSADVVYKVYHGNTKVEKITGTEAKDVKRKIKHEKIVPQTAHN